VTKGQDGNKFIKGQTLLLIALSLSTLFIFVAIALYNNVTASRYQQVDMRVESLLAHPTKLAANLIVARSSDDRNTRINSKKQLRQLVDEVSANQYVTNLHIFAENGKLLNSSQDDFVTQLLANKQYVAAKGVRVYLRPLLAGDLSLSDLSVNEALAKNKPVGFLQLHFAYQDLLNTISIFQFNTVKSIALLLLLLSILAVFIGVTVNRVHYKFRLKG